MVSMSTCTNCGATKLAHRVCHACGYYNGKQVISIKTESAGTIVDA